MKAGHLMIIQILNDDNLSWQCEPSPSTSKNDWARWTEFHTELGLSNFTNDSVLRQIVTVRINLKRQSIASSMSSFTGRRFRTVEAMELFKRHMEYEYAPPPATPVDFPEIEINLRWPQ